ncbi:hypothetical protein PHMEG_00025340 [Phytophthora megakarya]|uniref:MULE transposase domain-containing protein n=1 Tax=Phytophthora megakarya TaxID=4795 RepID=A0A225VCE3_9STRA|nr:hypothetical protein PHMEG_00025340 [Phytophthora megakarya]
MKDYGRELESQGLKASRIHRGVARRFGLAESKMSTKQQGRPEVGNGSDENPVLVGLTTKCLLRNATCDPTSFVFHIDGTFKLNQVGYPVIFCGVSDRARSFHLVAMFISSQQLRALYVGALAALRNIYTAVTSQQLIVKYVMADAEAAQLNAVSQGFGSVSNLTYLICFYHVLAKVHERLKGFPSSLSERVVADIYDLHVAASNKVYDELEVSILAKWSHDTQLLTFQNHFTSVWMNLLSPTKWYSTTKNPVEQLNHLTKRDYILRTKHEIGALIGLLAEGCGNELARIRSFQEVHQATQQLSCWYPQTRTKIVCRHARCQQVFLHEFGRSREVEPVTAQMGAYYA